MEDNLPKECSILGCKRNAELYCNCKQLPDYICNDHKQHHLNTGTTHNLIQAYIEVDNHKLNSFVEILNIEINYFRQSKYAIISKTNEIISFLHQNSSKFIRDIDEILSKRLSEITSLQLSNKVFHSKLDHFNSLTKEPFNVDPGIIDVNHVLNTLKSMFSNILAPVSPVPNARNNSGSIINVSLCFFIAKRRIIASIRHPNSRSRAISSYSDIDPGLYRGDL